MNKEFLRIQKWILKGFWVQKWEDNFYWSRISMLSAEIVFGYIIQNRGRIENGGGVRDLFSLFILVLSGVDLERGGFFFNLRMGAKER